MVVMVMLVPVVVMVVIVMVVMMPATAVLVMVVIVVVVMMVMFMLVVVLAVVVVIIVVVVVMVTFSGKFSKFRLQRVGMFHGIKYTFAVQFAPGRSNNRRPAVVPAHKVNRRRKLALARNVYMTEYYASRVLNLVIKELAKVLHIHLALVGIYYRRQRINFRLG
jgi:hypothetical protein